MGAMTLHHRTMTAEATDNEAMLTQEDIAQAYQKAAARLPCPWELLIVRTAEEPIRQQTVVTSLHVERQGQGQEQPHGLPAAPPTSRQQQSPPAPQMQMPPPAPMQYYQHGGATDAMAAGGRRSAFRRRATGQ